MDTKNLNREEKRLQGWEDKFSDLITDFAGSMKFVYVHIAWFGFWILINLGILGVIRVFDPYPFGLLTLVVSLEAIFLSTFVLISQNRLAQRDEMRANLDFQTNVRAEKEVEYMKGLLETMAMQMGIVYKQKRFKKVKPTGK